MDPLVTTTFIITRVLFSLFVLGIVGGLGFVGFRILTDKKEK